MAFCENCGNKLEEGAKFCDSCGNPVSAESTPTKSGNGKLLGIICGAAGAAVLAIVLILVLVLGGGYSSAEDVAEAYVQAMIDQDADDIINCYPDFYLEYQDDELAKDVDELKEDLEETFDYWEDEYNMDEAVIERVKITSDGSDLEDLYDLSGYSWVKNAMTRDDKDAFDEWAMVEVKLEVKDEAIKWYVICICVDGDWYALG